jgi:nucleotidyltransferase substrate binding protein (TIGR01987 family)
MIELDVRWRQRLENYSKALVQLNEAVVLQGLRELSNIEKQGFIKAFEFTHELAWNVMKDFAQYQGSTQIMGSRDATRDAFKKGLIENGEAWMGMIITRNKAVHTYSAKIVDDIIGLTLDVYLAQFNKFEAVMLKISNDH